MVEAGAKRFRPIAMTAIAAILALMPLTIGLGQGSTMQQPLAIAIISGLMVTNAARPADHAAGVFGLEQETKEKDQCSNARPVLYAALTLLALECRAV